jgi:hypothetical protein
MSDYTDQEIAVIDADHKWWHAFGIQFGWRLYGFTDRKSAQFILTDKTNVIRLTRQERDDIQAGIDREKSISNSQGIIAERLNNAGYTRNTESPRVPISQHPDNGFYRGKHATRGKHS